MLVFLVENDSGWIYHDAWFFMLCIRYFHHFFLTGCCYWWIFFVCWNYSIISIRPLLFFLFIWFFFLLPPYIVVFASSSLAIHGNIFLIIEQSHSSYLYLLNNNWKRLLIPITFLFEYHFELSIYSSGRLWCFSRFLIKWNIFLLYQITLLSFF